MLMLGDFIKSVPPITRWYFISITALSMLVYLKPKLETKMYLIKGREYEIWRYFTNILYTEHLSIMMLFKLIIEYIAWLLVSISFQR